MRACGLDFGTSNSTLAVADATGARLLPVEGAEVTLPTAVFWHEDGPPSFGRAAIADYIGGEEGRLMRGLKSTLGSSLIGERTRVGARAISFREVIGRFVGHLRGCLPAPLPAVVMGRPVHFVDDDAAGDARAEAVLAEIAREAGFAEVSFQFEPIAAALHYETSITAEELVLVVDIGGGTSDVSLVRVGPDRRGAPDRADDILGSGGIRVGGTDFDRALSLAAALPELGFGAATKGGQGTMPRHYYLDLATWHRINALYTLHVRNDLRALRAEAVRPELIDRLLRLLDARQGHALALEVERSKIALSLAEIDRLHLAPLCGAPNPLVRRATLESAIAAPLARIGALIDGVMTQAGVSADRVGTVFLTGGSSRLPALRAMVAAQLPGARLASGDDLGSVGTGLALEARRRFG